MPNMYNFGLFWVQIMQKTTPKRPLNCNSWSSDHSWKHTNFLSASEHDSLYVECHILYFPQIFLLGLYTLVTLWGKKLKWNSAKHGDILDRPSDLENDC